MLQLKWGVIPILTISALIIAMVLMSVPEGFQQIEKIGWSHFQLHNLIFRSSFIGLTVGAGTFLLGCLSCYALPHPYFDKFLNTYLAPSTALTAFAFLLLDIPDSLILTSIALICLFLPLTLRLNVLNSFRGLTDQIEVARVMGATPGQIFSQVSFPQIARPMGVAAGIAAFWAVGDFAVSGILLDQPALAVTSKKLMESYRVEAASLFVLLLLLLGSAMSLIFWGSGYVFSKRPISRLRRL